MQNMKVFAVFAGLLAGSFNVEATVEVNITAECSTLDTINIPITVPVGVDCSGNCSDAFKDAVIAVRSAIGAIVAACPGIAEYAGTTAFVTESKTRMITKANFYGKIGTFLAAAVPIEMISKATVDAAAASVMKISTLVFGPAVTLDAFSDVPYTSLYPLDGAPATTKVTVTMDSVTSVLYDSSVATQSNYGTCIPMKGGANPDTSAAVSVEGGNSFVEMYVLSGCSAKTFATGTTTVGSCPGSGSVSYAATPGIGYYQSMMIKPCPVSTTVPTSSDPLAGCKSCLFGTFDGSSFDGEGFVIKGGCKGGDEAFTDTAFWTDACFKCDEVAKDYCGSENGDFAPSTDSSTSDDGRWWLYTAGGSTPSLANIELGVDFTKMFECASSASFSHTGSVFKDAGIVAGNLNGGVSCISTINSYLSAGRAMTSTSAVGDIANMSKIQ